MEDGLGILEDVSGTSFSDTGLSTGQTYYYAVSALNVEGESEMTDIVSVMVEDEAPLMTLIHVEDYTTFTIIYVGEGVYFDIAGGRHEVMVESITGSNTIVSIDQGAMSITMKEGDSKAVDVNNDGTDDFIINCETIKWSNTEAVELSFTTDKKESRSGIPGFEPLTLAVGGLLSLILLRLKKVGSSGSYARVVETIGTFNILTGCMHFDNIKKIFSKNLYYLKTSRDGFTYD